MLIGGSEAEQRVQKRFSEPDDRFHHVVEQPEDEQGNDHEKAGFTTAFLLFAGKKLVSAGFG